MGIETRGYPLLDEIKAANGWPSEARFKKGPVAIIECVQGIPCNPCQEACPQKAIHVGDSITNTPKLDAEACIGCGLCIAACPGLAIFVVDKSGEKALISFPSIFNGEHVSKTDMVKIFTGNEIKVRFSRPCAAQIDGETVLNVTEYRAVQPR